MKVVTITSREEREDQNGSPYALLTVEEDTSTVVKLPNGVTTLVKGRPKTTATTAWERAYYEKDEDGKAAGPLNFEYTLSEGDSVMGSIVTRKVQPYEIEGRVVDTMTVLVIGNSDAEDWEIQVEKAFTNKQAVLQEIEA